MDWTGEMKRSILAGDDDTLGCNVKTSSYSCHLWMEKIHAAFEYNILIKEDSSDNWEGTRYMKCA